MLPDNIALFAAETGARGEAVRKILAGTGSLEEDLLTLGRLWRFELRFSEPVEVHVNRYRRKVTDKHMFSGFFKDKTNDSFCYAYHKSEHGTLSGFYAGYRFLDRVVGYSLVDVARAKSFKGYEQFAKRFDRRFITETEIQNLWAGTSGQHGGKYKPTDFHTIGRKGRGVVERFLERYVGLDGTPNIHYTENKNEDGSVYHYLTVYENAWRASGRDIKVEHRPGMPYVWYSSEFPKHGNGRYGLLATEKTFLWLEDD
jgi:hypothetical protein